MIRSLVSIDLRLYRQVMHGFFDNIFFLGFFFQISSNPAIAEGSLKLFSTIESYVNTANV